MNDWDTKFPISKIEKREFKEYFLLKRLLEIPDCPHQIFYRGSFANHCNLKFLTVVGSRRISSYAKDVIKVLMQGLAGQPICILSGLAIGVDTEAHLQALEYNLQVIAVPGSGIGFDKLYPATNKHLAKKILEKDGLILNEFEPDFSSTVWSFPMRNRIMAALSDAVLIIEAANKSGTLITAQLAIEYNRDVFCVPGSIFNTNSQGSNKLISEGAKVINNYNDILEGLNLKTVTPSTQIITKPNDYLLNLTKSEKKLIVALENEKTREELQKITQLNISEFLGALTSLEFKGLIKDDAGLIRKTH